MQIAQVSSCAKVTLHSIAKISEFHLHTAVICRLQLRHDQPDRVHGLVGEVIVQRLTIADTLGKIPDFFVIGYGLDCGEHFRNLPYIAEYTED